MKQKWISAQHVRVFLGLYCSLWKIHGFYQVTNEYYKSFLYSLKWIHSGTERTYFKFSFAFTILKDSTHVQILIAIVILVRNKFFKQPPAFCFPCLIWILQTLVPLLNSTEACSEYIVYYGSEYPMYLCGFDWSSSVAVLCKYRFTLNRQFG